MLRTTANMLATGLLFLGLLHSLEVIAPGRAIDGKQSWFKDNQSPKKKMLRKKKNYTSVCVLIITGFIVFCVCVREE